MWKRIVFANMVFNAWVPPEDLWGILAPKNTERKDGQVLALISDDAPYRWVSLA